MQHLYDKARADGIAVPIFHNDKGRNGYLGAHLVDRCPARWSARPTCTPSTATPAAPATPTPPAGSPNVAPDWGLYGPGGAKGGASASPNTPGFVAEFGGGWFDYWGSNGTYPCTAVREGPGYERVFYGTNIANGLTLQNFYMTFGGTSWGWLPAPVVYTSYDYGAAINEDRQLRPKAYTLKEMGYFLQSVPELDQDREGPGGRAVVGRDQGLPPGEPGQRHAVPDSPCTTRRTPGPTTPSRCRSPWTVAPTPCRRPARWGSTARTRRSSSPSTTSRASGSSTPPRS